MVLCCIAVRASVPKKSVKVFFFNDKLTLVPGGIEHRLDGMDGLVAVAAAVVARGLVD